MSAGNMHVDEVDVDVSLVGRLLAAQFPDWAELPIERVRSGGTDNAIYRLGDNLCVRLPRIERVTAQLDKELEWLPRLAPHLPLAVPVAHEGQVLGIRSPLRVGIAAAVRGQPLGAAAIDGRYVQVCI